MTMTSTTVGTTIASTTAGTTMAATVIAGSITGMTSTAEGYQRLALSLFCLSVRPLLLLCHKGNEDQLYCTTAGREASASPQTDLS